MLHNPFDGTTPSQRQAAVAHRERLFRLSGHAVKLRDEVPPTVEVQTYPLEKRWADRQKEEWFSIVAEVGPPRIEDIIRAVCKHFSVTRIDLLSARRTRRITGPRQVGYYLAKKLTKHSLPEIARRFGNRDHTSALHGIRKIEELRPINSQIDADVREIAGSFGEVIA
jgi:hypothetical protein